MKKLASVFAYLLFILITLLPICVILSYYFGYQFEFTNYSVFSVITALSAVVTTVLCIISKISVKNKIDKILFALLTPFSLINAAFYFFMSTNITVWIAISMIVCMICCVYITAKHLNHLTIKITSLVTSALMFLPIVFFGFLALFFGNIGQNTVVKSIESPNGAYYAEVIDSNQGALGGDTLVDVYKNKTINTVIFKIKKKPQRVYYGEWGEFEDIEIYWKNENCLIINSVEYKIK